MITQTITLKIIVENDNYLPENWNWEELLDLAPTESVEIVEVKLSIQEKTDIQKFMEEHFKLIKIGA